MPTRIEQENTEASGDLLAYSIKETGGDIAIDAAENTVPTGNVTSPARAFVSGDSVYLQGQIDFDGADAVLNFTLPAGLRPLQNIVDICAVTDASATPTGVTGTVTVSTAGAVTVTMAGATAFATGDAVHLNTSYVRA